MGAIFVSYRRGDSEGQAKALYIQLLNSLEKILCSSTPTGPGVGLVGGTFSPKDVAHSSFA
jgi:hypothetical protein